MTMGNSDDENGEICLTENIWHRSVRRGRIAAKFPRDGRLAPVQQMGNLRDGFAIRTKKEYLFSLKWCKVSAK